MELPAPIPESCPGLTEAAGKAPACEGCPNQASSSWRPAGLRLTPGTQAVCAAPKVVDPDLAAIQLRMRDIKHKASGCGPTTGSGLTRRSGQVLVLSGKGGVGKSTVSSQLAHALSSSGYQVGLLDIDICGPSLPRMLGLEGEEVHQSSSGWSPVYVNERLGVMSIGFMLTDRNEAVVWRGPRKNGLIKQFLKDVDWGPLDYLVSFRRCWHLKPLSSDFPADHRLASRDIRRAHLGHTVPA